MKGFRPRSSVSKALTADTSETHEKLSLVFGQGGTINEGFASAELRE